MASMSEMVYSQFQKEGYENVQMDLYDSMLTIAGATQTIKFFQNNSSTGKTRTNMQSGGQLPDPQAFLITGLECHVFNLDGTPFTETGAGTAVVYPLNALMSKAYMKIQVDPKTMYETHMRTMYSQVDNGLHNSATPNQITNIGGMLFKKSLKLQIPIMILPQRHFEIEMTLTTPAEAGGYTASNTLIMWVLKGILRRNSN